MQEQYRTHCPEEQADRAVDREEALQLVKRLDQFLAPLAVILDAYLDSRLVRTLLELRVSLIPLRHREAGVVLSELGAMLLSPQHAPAGSQRIERWLPSPNWSAWLIEPFLWRRAKLHLEALEQRGETALILHDGSELEKPESVRVEGLCPVRSAKGRRLSRPRPQVQCVSPTKGAPILVPGSHWHAAVLLGLTGLPCVAQMRYWTSRGTHASQGRLEEHRLLRQLAHAWGRRVIHVFDRGWAGGPWLQVVTELGQRLVERWNRRYHLRDEQGVERKAWEIARGKRESIHGKLWWAKFGREIHLSSKLRAVRHSDVPGQPLFLVEAFAKEWSSPWYLLTHESLSGVQDALHLVQIYCRRGPIEWSFRFEKSELGIEHMRVREWQAHLKALALVTLVYALLLSLLQEEGALVRVWVLDRWDHQTGKQARERVQPRYRLRRALWRWWQCYRPHLHDRPAWLLSGSFPSTQDFCSQSLG